MALTGEAKRRYMCEYMRSYRARRKTQLDLVRPITDVPPSVRTDPGLCVLANPAVFVKSQIQHDNPMMVGYEPLPR